MKKLVHDTDVFFQSAYRQFEADPSPDVWAKLHAELDRNDAVRHRKQLGLWKKAGLLFLLLVPFLTLSDTGIFNNNTDRQEGKASSNTVSAPQQKEHPSSSNQLLKDNTTKETAPVATTTIPYSTGKILLPYPEPGVPKTFSRNHLFNLPPHINGAREKTRILSATHSENSPGKEKIVTGSKIESPWQMLFPITIHQERTLPEQKLFPSFLRFDNRKTARETNLQKRKKEEALHRPHWLMTAFAAYNQANYKLDSDVPGSITSIRHREVHEPSYTGGLLLTWQARKRWSLQSGLSFSHIAIGILPQKMYAFQEPGGGIAYKYVTSSGYAYIKPAAGPPPAFGDSLTAEAKHTLQSISVPLSVRYSTTKNKWTLATGTGIEGSLLTTAKLEVEVEDAQNREAVSFYKLRGTKSFYWSGVADAEVQYRLNKKLSLSLRPSFRYALSPITENNVVETFPYSFDVSTGLVYRFK